VEEMIYGECEDCGYETQEYDDVTEMAQEIDDAGGKVDLDEDEFSCPECGGEIIIRNA
jgi:Zn finger protein HypA/HybF involved in hydrogenase expression